MMRVLGLWIMVAFLLSCEKYEEDAPFVEWKIKKGTHGQKAKFSAIEFEFLSYDIIFDSSAIYQNADPVNQYDINKLYGFSDCDNFHQINSARFGWRWGTDPDSTGLLIYAYDYVNSNRQIQFLAKVDLYRPYRYYLGMNKDHYIFFIEEAMQSVVIMPRGNTCDRGLYYELFPYFGGDEVAPHDITIYRKRNLLEKL